MTTLLLASVFAGPAAAAPANDNFANAQIVTVPALVSGVTIGATREPGEPQPCGLIGSTVWYRLDMPDVGGVAATTIHDATDKFFDSVVALYAGTSLSDLVLIECNDDYRPTYPRSAVLGEPVARASYWLQVGGYNGYQTSSGFTLQASFRASGNRNCGTTEHFYSSACHFTSQRAGVQATWKSEPLNISQEAAHAGTWIQQAIWLNNLTNQAAVTWLEMGDSAGTSRMENPQRPDMANQWERWWFWVDGRTSGVYHEYAIQQAPVGDGIDRTWIIQWDGSVSGWGMYECELGTCYKKGSAPWTPPAEMTSQELVVGAEVSWPASNWNTNSTSNHFIDANMMVRDLSGAWPSWPSASVQIDAGCGSGYPLHFCLNGTWNSPAPPYTNWRNNKP